MKELSKKEKEEITAEVLSGKKYQMLCTHCGLMCDGVTMIKSLCEMFSANHRKAHKLDVDAVTLREMVKIQ